MFHYIGMLCLRWWKFDEFLIIEYLSSELQIDVKFNLKEMRERCTVSRWFHVFEKSIFYRSRRKIIDRSWSNEFKIEITVHRLIKEFCTVWRNNPAVTSIHYDNPRLPADSLERLWPMTIDTIKECSSREMRVTTTLTIIRSRGPSISLLALDCSISLIGWHSVRS